MSNKKRNKKRKARKKAAELLKQSKPRKPTRREWTKNRATELRTNLPKSEQWFMDELIKSGYSVEYFGLASNQYFATKIPDFINRKTYTIIEVDGSIHENANVKRNDAKKNKIFNDHGYHVIRVIAYDMDSYEKGLEMMLKQFESKKSYVRVISDVVRRSLPEITPIEEQLINIKDILK